MVLFAYIWMFITFDNTPLQPFTYLFLLFVLPLSTVPFSPSSISSYLTSSRLLLFLVCLLFWAIVVVVSVLDLSLGGFSS